MNSNEDLSAVLVLDCCQDSGEVIQVYLENLGYRAIITTNEKEAVCTFKDEVCNIDLVMVDISNNELIKCKAIELIKDLNPDVKIIYTSGIPKKDCRNSDKYLEGIEFLRKPFNFSDLSKTISLNLMNECVET